MHSPVPSLKASRVVPLESQLPPLPQPHLLSSTLPLPLRSSLTPSIDDKPVGEGKETTFEETQKLSEIARKRLRSRRLELLKRACIVVHVLIFWVIVVLCFVTLFVFAKDAEDKKDSSSRFVIESLLMEGTMVLKKNIEISKAESDAVFKVTDTGSAPACCVLASEDSKILLNSVVFSQDDEGIMIKTRDGEECMTIHTGGVETKAVQIDEGIHVHDSFRMSGTQSVSGGSNSLQNFDVMEIEDAPFVSVDFSTKFVKIGNWVGSSSAAFIAENGNLSLIVNGEDGTVQVAQGLINSDPIQTCVGTFCFERGVLNTMVMSGMNGVEIDVVQELVLGHTNRTANKIYDNGDDAQIRVGCDVESCPTCVMMLESIQSKMLDSFSQIWDVGHGNLSLGGTLWFEGPAVLEAGCGASGWGDGSIPRGDGGTGGSGGNVVISGRNVTFSSEGWNLFRSRTITIAGGKLCVGQRSTLSNRNSNAGKLDLEWPFASSNVRGETVIWNHGFMLRNQTDSVGDGGDSVFVVSQRNAEGPLSMAIRGDVPVMYLGRKDGNEMPIGVNSDGTVWTLGCSIQHSPSHDERLWVANGSVSVQSNTYDECGTLNSHADCQSGRLHLVGNVDISVSGEENGRVGMFLDAEQLKGSFCASSSCISLDRTGIDLNAVGTVSMNVARMVVTDGVSVAQSLNLSGNGREFFSGGTMEVSFASGYFRSICDLTLSASGIPSQLPDVTISAGSSKVLLPSSLAGTSMQISFERAFFTSSTKDILTFRPASLLHVQFDDSNFHFSMQPQNMSVGNLIIKNCTLFSSDNESSNGPMLDAYRAIVGVAQLDGSFVTIDGGSGGVEIQNVMGTFVPNLVMEGSGMHADFQEAELGGKALFPLSFQPSSGKVTFECVDSELFVGDDLVLASGILKSHGVSIDYFQSIAVGKSGAEYFAFQSSHNFVVLDSPDFDLVLEGSFSLMENDASLFTLSLADSRVISSDSVAFVVDGNIIFSRKNSAVVEIFVGNAVKGSTLQFSGGSGLDQRIRTSSTNIALSENSLLSAVSGRLILKSSIDKTILSGGNGCVLGVAQTVLSTDGRLIIEMNRQLLRTTSGAMVVAGANSLDLMSGGAEVAVTRRDGVDEPLTAYCGAASAGATMRRPLMTNVSSLITHELRLESSNACDLCGDAAPFVIKSGDAMDMGVGGRLILSGGACNDCDGGCVVVGAGVDGGAIGSPSNVSMSCAMLEVKSLENKSDGADLFASDASGIGIGGLHGEDRNATQSTKVRSQRVHVQGGMRVQLFNGEELFGSVGSPAIEIGNQFLSNFTESLTLFAEEMEWKDEMFGNSLTLGHNAAQINRTSISMMAANMSIGTDVTSLNRSEEASFRGERVIFNATTGVLLESTSKIFIGAGAIDYASTPRTSNVTLCAHDIHFWVHGLDDSDMLNVSTSASLESLYHEYLINVTTSSEDTLSSSIEIGNPFGDSSPTDFVVVSGNTIRLDSSGGSGLKMNGSNYIVNCEAEKVHVSSNMNVQPGFKWKESGGKLIPSGAVMFFRKTSCPNGWTYLAGSDGFVVMGMSEYPGQNYDDLLPSLKRQGSSRGHGTSVTVDLLTNAGTSGSTTHNHGFTAANNAVSTTSARFDFGGNAASTGHSHTGTTDFPSHSHAIPQQDVSQYHYDICPVMYLIACVKD